MPRITRKETTALAFCAQQLLDGELSFDGDGCPNGEERCPGYAQQQVDAIVETIEWTFGDINGGGGDVMDMALAGNVSHSHERVLFRDPADMACPYCGTPRQISTQVRPRYAALGGVRGGPDVLFADRKARREQGVVAARGADASERQAAALEAANELKARELDLRERELEAQIARRRRPVEKAETT